MSKKTLKETKEQAFDLNLGMKELKKIASWFEEQKEVSLEESILMLRKGARIVIDSKTRLKQIENEFNEIKREIERLD